MNDVNAKAATPIWHCDLHAPESGTVGLTFAMNCSGDIPVQWAGAPKIVLPEKTLPYSLVILETKKLEPTAADFVVTSYRTGEFKPEFIRVMTGDVGFEASGLTWKTQSVLKQGEQPKPFGPYGPLRLPMPIWVWVAIALLLASVSSGLWLWFKRIQDRRRLAEDLGRHASAVLTPAAQFHKELRALSKKLIAARDCAAVGEWNSLLDQAVRVYLLREFQFLALRVGRMQLLHGWKKKRREDYNEFSAGLEKIFSEMDRFQVHAADHKAGEYEQILNLARKWCDRIEAVRAKKAKLGRV